MPFKSKAQRSKFYALFEQGKISHRVLSEWETATGKKKLPERVGKKKKKG